MQVEKARGDTSLDHKMRVVGRTLRKERDNNNRKKKSPAIDIQEMVASPKSKIRRNEMLFVSFCCCLVRVCVCVGSGMLLKDRFTTRRKDRMLYK